MYMNMMQLRINQASFGFMFEFGGINGYFIAPYDS